MKITGVERESLRSMPVVFMTAMAELLRVRFSDTVMRRKNLFRLYADNKKIDQRMEMQ